MLFMYLICIVFLPTVPNWIFAIIIVLLFLTVVGIPIAIAMICMKCNKNNEGNNS